MSEDHQTTLDRIADAFIVSSLESFNAHGDLTDREFVLAAWSSLQQIIDNVNDHNEMMLEAIETVSPDLAKLVTELMNDQSHYNLWCEIVNACFRTVEAKLS